MAILATTVWRTRPSGNNVNGGGYDSAVSGVLATTLASTLATAATSMVVTSDSGWPGSGNYYSRLSATIGGQLYNEIVLITAGQGTTTRTVTRGQLGTSDPGVTWPAGTVVDNDFSQCDTAPATGTAGASTASTTFVDATFNAFNATHVGNVIWLASATGTPTVGAYIIQSITNSSTIVLDRVSGTYTLGVWKIGGAWADPQANLASTGPVVPGNLVYVLGSGIPNPASYTYDYTLPSYVTCAQGNTTNGLIKVLGDPCTPNFSTGGQPCIQVNFLAWYLMKYSIFQDIYFVAGSVTNNNFGPSNSSSLINVTLDQFGYDVGLALSVDGKSYVCFGCRVFSSVAKRSTNSTYAINTSGGATFGVLVKNCNVSNCIGPGVRLLHLSSMTGCLITKNGGDGVTLDETASDEDLGNLEGNTIDENLGHGINIPAQISLYVMTIFNNTITNHTTSGKYPITIGAGTTAQNDRVKKFVDFNVFYNNLNDPNAISYGEHDQVGGADPYVDQANDDYTLTSTYIDTGYPQNNFPGF